MMLLNCGAREDFWTARRSNQSVLKEISRECSLERLKKKIEKGMIEDEMVALTQ